MCIRDSFKSIQFNAVVELNAPAVRLWQSLGFDILGTAPESFTHPEHGLVGLHIMFRHLWAESAGRAFWGPRVWPWADFSRFRTFGRGDLPDCRARLDGGSSAPQEFFCSRMVKELAVLSAGTGQSLQGR